MQKRKQGKRLVSLQVQDNGSKMHNGNGRSVLFIHIAVREEVAREFKTKAREMRMEYSDYLMQLMKNEVLGKLLQEGSPYATSFTNLVAELAKRASQPPIQDYGFKKE